MEDHLKNKNRLEREWEALCSYQAEPSASCVGRGEQNTKRNRSDAVVACESSRFQAAGHSIFGSTRMLVDEYEWMLDPPPSDLPYWISIPRVFPLGIPQQRQAPDDQRILSHPH